MRDSLIILENLETFLSAALALAHLRVSWPGFQNPQFHSHCNPIVLLRTYSYLHPISWTYHSCYASVPLLSAFSTSAVRSKSKSHLSMNPFLIFLTLLTSPHSRLFFHEEICLIVHCLILLLSS